MSEYGYYVHEHVEDDGSILRHTHLAWVGRVHDHEYLDTKSPRAEMKRRKAANEARWDRVHNGIVIEEDTENMRTEFTSMARAFSTDGLFTILRNYLNRDELDWIQEQGAWAAFDVLNERNAFAN